MYIADENPMALTGSGRSEKAQSVSGEEPQNGKSERTIQKGGESRNTLFLHQKPVSFSGFGKNPNPRRSLPGGGTRGRPQSPPAKAADAAAGV